MNRHLQTTLLGLAIISLILSCWVSVNADTAEMTTSQVRYHHYLASDHFRQYHRFLPSPKPKELRYHTRMMAAANIDDTPQNETIVLIFVGPDWNARIGNWRKAFLLITDNNAAVPKKKAFFKLFDTGTYKLDVPATGPIEFHRSPFALTQPTDVSFRLADVTGNGTLDIWVESVYGVALISFENGEFKEVFNRYTVTREKFTDVPEIEYHYYDSQSMPEGRMYHRFLPTPLPEEHSYSTLMTAVANIDDTPEKENIVLMIAYTADYPQGWFQAFLLIVENETGEFPKKKALFKLFDSGTYDLDVPGKIIEVQSTPFVFREWTNNEPWKYQSISFKLVDLTGDGTLDLWIKGPGVVALSFQNDEFKKVLSCYSSAMEPPEYVDLDKDGTYEIKIPNTIPIKNVHGNAQPEWMSLYEWNGNTYVLNDRRFYAENDEFLIHLLRQYNYQLSLYGSSIPLREVYSFYTGLVFYYRGNVPMARLHLHWIVKNAEKQDYVRAAESLLKKLKSR